MTSFKPGISSGQQELKKLAGLQVRKPTGSRCFLDGAAFTEGGRLAVAAPAAESGLRSHSGTCQEVEEVKEVFWGGGNKNNLLLPLTGCTRGCAKCSPEDSTGRFYCCNETRSRVNAAAVAVAAAIAARCLRCPYPGVSEGLR